MGEGPQSSFSWGSFPIRYVSLILLTIQYTLFVLLLHYSRIMPAIGGQRYLTSTAVFLNEVIKLAISLTIALYEVSKRVPPSMPATSLFSSLLSSVFSGDSWKLAIPASLYTLANSLQYIALSNLEAATFQVTYQLKLVSTAFFGLVLLRRSIAPRRWAILLLLVAGAALVQLPENPSDPISLRDERSHLYFPRSLEEWNHVRGPAAANIRKRSATYEGIQEDLLLEHPPLNGAIGLLATIGACVASGLATVYFEKVVRESTTQTSLWIRNVQLAIYSIFPALFIGVVFLDGEKIANHGFFAGYNWAVWSTITIQALGGIGAAFAISYADRIAKNSAAAFSILLSTLGSLWLFDLPLTANFSIGAFVVLSVTYLYGNQSSGAIYGKGHAPRPPPIRVENYEKGESGEVESPVVSPPNDFSIKLPTSPLLSTTAGLSTSRPTSPIHHSRIGSARNAPGGYFPQDIPE